MKNIFKLIFLLSFSTLTLYSQSITLSGTLRDFKSSHPDFELYAEFNNWNFAGLDYGMVQDQLDENRNPVFNNSTKNSTTHNTFNQWYNDVSGVNQSMPYTITLEKQNNVYVYDSETNPMGETSNVNYEGFFPLDNQLFGNEGQEHNYHMTYEIHSQFTYQGGEIFTFSGDDDVWVFINNKLAVDIGGIHGKEEKSVNLDNLDLVIGNTYNFDMFWAERQTVESNFKITTSIELIDNPSLSIESNPSITEGDSGLKEMLFNIILNKPAPKKITFEYTLSNNSAIFGEDYQEGSIAQGQTISIPKNADSTSISVLIKGDTKVEDNETFTLKLSNIDNATFTPESVTAIATIMNDDEIISELACTENPSSIEVKISDDDDDAEERVSNGNMNIGSSDLEMTQEDHQQIIGLRFQNLSIPKGASITNAYIQFTSEEKDSDSTNLTIYGESTNHASQFISTAYNISNRNKTTAFVSWSPEAWMNKNKQDSEQRTSDLKSIVQEIVNKDGWNNGNAMAFIISGNGKRVADSYDGSSSKAPYLHVEFNDCSDPSSETSSATCYALTDNNKKLYKVSMIPNGDPLPFASVVNIDKQFNGEGSAYRASNHTFYAFQGNSDDSGPSDLYTINVNSGATEKVKNNIISGAVDGAEFYFDPVLNKEILYIISGEYDSKLYAFDPDNWTVLDGYPKNTNVDLSSLAIDPLTGLGYAIDDYDYSNLKPPLYSIDLKTGLTTFVTRLQNLADAEGLAFASDGNLYVEDEGRDDLDGKRLYKVNLQTGVLVPSAITNADGDIEGLSCNGTQIAIENASISIASNPSIVEGDTSTTQMFFNIVLNRPAPKEISFSYKLSDNTAMLGEDYQEDSIAQGESIIIPKDANGTSISVLIKGDTQVEDNETFTLELTNISNAIFTPESVTALATIINDDNEESNPIGCLQTAFMFQNKPTDINALNLANGEMTSIKNNVSDDNINALGFNKKDGYFWGYNHTTQNGTISRIGMDKQGDWITEDFLISGLDGFDSYVGDVDNNGHLYLKVNGNGQRVVVIDLDPKSLTYLTKIREFELSFNLTTADWGFNPKDNKLYAVNNGNGTKYLYKIDPLTGQELSKQDTSLVGNRGFGASFFDASGFYYIYDNKSGNIYRIDVANSAEAVWFAESTKVSLNDGAMCTDAEFKFDFGDLPENYPTKLESNGARHSLPSYGNPTIYLGNGVSNENNGKPSVNANLDEQDDGVKIGTVSLQGYQITSLNSLNNINIETKGSGYLNAWIDWNRDGQFTVSEQIAKDVDGSSGSIYLQVNASDVAKLNFNGENIYARFRYSSQQELNATGSALDGEVEDYSMKTLHNFPTILLKDISHTEGDSGTKAFTFTLRLSEVGLTNRSVQYATSNGTAMSDSDYIPSSGTVVFPAGTQEQTITIYVKGDTLKEGSETFYVMLSNAFNLLLDDTVMMATIEGDDTLRFAVERTNSKDVENNPQSLKENLYTQISGRAFDYSLVGYDKNDDPQMVKNITLKVELLDRNTTLTNDILYTKYVHLGDSSSNRYDVLQDIKIDRATRLANYRVSYLVDENGTLVYGSYTNSNDYAIKALTTNESSNYSHSFAIRPAHFHVSIKESNEFNNTLYRDSSYLENDYLNLSTGYNYTLFTKATPYGTTNLIENYETDNAKELNSTLIFNKNSTMQCADEKNYPKEYNFKDSKINATFTHTNVGQYTLHIEDVNWTDINKNLNNIGCVLNSASNIPNSSGKVGCNIASNEGDSYKDLKIHFQPYAFNLTNMTFNNSNKDGRAYLYTNNLNDSDEMAVEISSTIIAEDKNGQKLTNFSKSCLANDVELSLNFIPTFKENYSDEQGKVEIKTSNGTPVYPQQIVKLNGLNGDVSYFKNIHIKANDFLDENEGNTSLKVSYNMEKHYNEATNPIQVNFVAFDANSTASKSMREGKEQEALHKKNSGIIDQTRTFFYARIRSDKEVYPETTKKIIHTPLMVEIYCKISKNRSWCDNDMNLKNIGFNTQKTDLGWYVDREHNSKLDSNVSSLISSNSDFQIEPAIIPSFLNGRINNIYVKYSKSVPETLTKTEIEINTQPWLRYHKNTDNSAGIPFFRLAIKDISALTGIGVEGNQAEITKKIDANGKMDW
ncbi:MAG: Unknown protein [uncultured Sulfurovum sp.]|uniref:PA14 domain-containing protein n=1 Tax=uncultured Sulfurovum sp. TaxID=269237 RepID=A0A6S6TJY4_9BACT|nr:MAG: Unknown protein [uncultured Sulfurovum sp.]